MHLTVNRRREGRRAIAGNSSPPIGTQFRGGCWRCVCAGSRVFFLTKAGRRERRKAGQSRSCRKGADKGTDPGRADGCFRRAWSFGPMLIGRSVCSGLPARRGLFWLAQVGRLVAAARSCRRLFVYRRRGRCGPGRGRLYNCGPSYPNVGGVARAVVPKRSFLAELTANSTSGAPIQPRGEGMRTAAPSRSAGTRRTVGIDWCSPPGGPFGVLRQVRESCQDLWVPTARRASRPARGLAGRRGGAVLLKLVGPANHRHPASRPGAPRWRAGPLVAGLAIGRCLHCRLALFRRAGVRRRNRRTDLGLGRARPAIIGGNRATRWTRKKTLITEVHPNPTTNPSKLTTDINKHYPTNHTTHNNTKINKSITTTT